MSHSGLKVSDLDSRSSGLGLSPGRGHCVVFLGKALHCHIASVHPGKLVPVNLMLGVTPRWTSIPSSKEQKYSQLLHVTETGINSGLMGHLAHTSTLPIHRNLCQFSPSLCIFVPLWFIIFSLVFFYLGMVHYYFQVPFNINLSNFVCIQNN